MLYCIFADVKTLFIESTSVSSRENISSNALTTAIISAEEKTSSNEPTSFSTGGLTTSTSKLENGRENKTLNESSTIIDENNSSNQSSSCNETAMVTSTTTFPMESTSVTDGQEPSSTEITFISDVEKASSYESTSVIGREENSSTELSTISGVLQTSFSKLKTGEATSSYSETLEEKTTSQKSLNGEGASLSGESSHLNRVLISSVSAVVAVILAITFVAFLIRLRYFQLLISQ